MRDNLDRANNHDQLKIVTASVRYISKRTSNAKRQLQTNGRAFAAAVSG